MRENKSIPEREISSAKGRALQILRTLVTKRMIANMETTPVAAMLLPNNRDGSGLNSEGSQTSSGRNNAQNAMAQHISAFPDSIAFREVHAPNRSTKICVKSSDTNIW